MAYKWQLQEAKNKFSEVVDEAISHGPQVITRRGIETVVVLSYAEYRVALTPDGMFHTESDGEPCHHVNAAYADI